MNHGEIHPDFGPTSEQFAAFLDGELGADVRARVEAWLQQHPADAEEIEGQRKLMRLWQMSAPTEPNPAAWSAAFDRIDAQVRPASRRRRMIRRTLWLSAGPVAAAAVLAAVMLTRDFRSGARRDAPTTTPPVAGAEAAEQGPILLASQDDVSVVSMESYWQDDGRVPAIGEGDVSMIVAAPLAREP